MSIIYEALQKIERKSKEGIVPAIDSSIIQKENFSIDSAHTKPRFVVLTGFAFLALLLLGIYFLRMQPVPVPPSTTVAKFTTVPVQQQTTISKVLPAVNVMGDTLFSTQSESLNEQTAPYTLQGIIYDEKNPLALINGKKVGLGERIGNAVVLDISGNGVELLVNEEKIFLPLD
jgi:hypothetical protein